MSKPTGASVAAYAVTLLNGPVIKYSDTDCQGFMEKIIWESGATRQEMPNYAGSNDMYRNACTWTGTIDEAKRLGYLIPGAALFIVKNDGNEPAKYRSDGKGNASHVGMYIGENAFYDKEKQRWCDVAHSSSSRGKVCGSTLQNAWTHVGLWKAVQYPASSENEKPRKEVVPVLYEGYIRSSNGKGANLRAKAMTTSSLLDVVPDGGIVQVISENSAWTKVEYNDKTGFVLTKLVHKTTEKNDDIVTIELPISVAEALKFALMDKLGVG